MNRKIIGNILILLGLLLIAAAAALVVQNVMAQEEAETSAQQVLVHAPFARSPFIRGGSSRLEATNQFCPKQN